MPEQMKAFVEQRLKGGFGNVSEYFRHWSAKIRSGRAERLEALLLKVRIPASRSRLIQRGGRGRKPSSQLAL